jgi:sugar phosphate isomerase/epimerase
MISLSSAWRSAPTLGGEEIFDPLFQALDRFPFSGLALDAGVSSRALDEVHAVLARREFPITLLRGPVGRPPPGPAVKGPLLTPRLCAPDEAERRQAVEALLRALEIASDLEVPVLSISAGAVDGDPRFGRRDRAFTEDESADLARVARAAGAARPRALDALRFALEALVTRAAALGVRVALENPVLPLELPSPEELHGLLAEFQGLPLAFAHDVGAARLCKELGGAAGREYLDAGRDLLVAVFLSDAHDREMGLVPGAGSIDFAGFAKALPAAVVKVLVPRRDWSERDLEAALEHLAECGLLPPAA